MDEVIGMIIGSWLGTCIVLFPDPPIFLSGIIGVVSIRLLITAYKDMQRSWS